MNQKISIALLVATIMISGIGMQYAFADVVSPKKQLSLSFSSDDIVCKEGFIKITNTHNDPACVKISSVDKLVRFGWAMPVDKTLLDMRMSGDLQPVGTVKILDKVKIFTDSGRLDSEPRSVGDNVVFEACTKSTVRAPEVAIMSDSEVKRVKLSEKIDANTCQITATTIKSSDPESIKATMTNKGGITAKITSLENKINGLKENLINERAKLSGVTSDTTSETVLQASKKISELRNDIIKTKDELNKYQLALYVQPTHISELKSKTYSESPVIGASITKIAVQKSLIQPTTQPKNVLSYSTIFQICAEKNAIHAPEILVTSDIQTKSVKLSDDIAPNTCQRSSVDIGTENAKSITITLKNKGEISSSIDALEKKIFDIQEKLKTEKENLANLIHQKPRSLDYNKMVTLQTEKIEQLRTELNNAKVSLYGILNTR